MRRPLTSLLALGACTALLVPAVTTASGAATVAHPRAVVAAQPRTNVATARVKLKPVLSGLDRPVAMLWRHGDLPHVYVVQQSGTLVRMSGGRIGNTVLTLPVSSGNERGFLGAAFSRDGKKLYADYTSANGDIRVVSYKMKGNVANTATRRVLLAIPHHEFDNHNGGNLVIGPDNMLYVGVGDGGSGGDPHGNAQNTNSLLGKILRINPEASGGAGRIPDGNPFKGKPGHRGAIWMFGLRNPWRFSFDRSTKDMWIGDVGQDLYEEVDFARAGNQKGANWGWNRREGKHPYNGGTRPPHARDPIVERPHTAGDCAIIGGYVYRGAPKLPLVGAYVYGDECTGVIRALVQKGGRATQNASLSLTVSQLSSFGQGPSGGLFAISLAGTIYQIVPA
jgi:glucose/arabinose dehydrogenase